SPHRLREMRPAPPHVRGVKLRLARAVGRVLSQEAGGRRGIAEDAVCFLDEAETCQRVQQQLSSSTVGANELRHFFCGGTLANRAEDVELQGCENYAAGYEGANGFEQVIRQDAGRIFAFHHGEILLPVIENLFAHGSAVVTDQALDRLALSEM